MLHEALEATKFLFSFGAQESVAYYNALPIAQEGQ